MKTKLKILTLLVVFGTLGSSLPARAEENSLKSPAGALGLAIAPFIAGIPLMFSENEEAFIAGMAITAIGPIAGHIYAGSTMRGIAFTVARIGFMSLGTIGVISAIGDADYGRSGNGYPLFFIGVAGTVVTTIWGAIDASNSAERYNEKARRIGFAPLFMKDRQTGTSYGGSLTMSF